METSSNASKNRDFSIVALACVLVVGLWFVWFFVYFGYWGSKDAAQVAGQVGDKFGPLNTLFTGLAFVGLIATLSYQINQAKEAKNDLNNILKALGSTAEALNRQAEHSKTIAYITALEVRIDAYTMQRERDRHQGWLQSLMDEQESLLWELSDILGKVRNEAGGREVSAKEIEARIRANIERNTKNISSKLTEGNR